MKPSRYRGIEKTQKEINAVLDKIRAEIEHEGAMFPDGEFFVSIDRINEIIDKYKRDNERKESVRGIQDDVEVVDRKCSKCVNANNPVVCSWNMKDIAEEKGCDFWQDSDAKMDEPQESKG